MGDAIGELEDTVTAAGAIPIIVHHFTKSIKVGKIPTFDMMTQSGAGERAATRILVNHRQGFEKRTNTARLFLEAESRLGTGGSWAVDISEGRMARDGTGRVWQARVLTDEEYEAMGSAEPVEDGDGGLVNRSAAVRHADRLRQFMQRGRGPYLRTDMRNELRCNATVLATVLAEMTRQGWLADPIPQARGGEAYNLSDAGRASEELNDNI